jgi:hypothetical protein
VCTSGSSRTYVVLVSASWTTDVDGQSWQFGGASGAPIDHLIRRYRLGAVSVRISPSPVLVAPSSVPSRRRRPPGSAESGSPDGSRQRVRDYGQRHGVRGLSAWERVSHAAGRLRLVLAARAQRVSAAALWHRLVPCHRVLIGHAAQFGENVEASMLGRDAFDGMLAGRGSKA